MSRLLVVSRNAAIAMALAAEEYDLVVLRPDATEAWRGELPRVDAAVFDFGNAQTAVEVVEGLRKDGLTLPLVIATNGESRWDSLRSTTLPGIGLLQLPLSKRALVTAVRDVLAGSPGFAGGGPGVESTSIGAQLRAAREQHHLSLSDLSRRTLILESTIGQIENDDFSGCGDTFFARGHVRAIATAVGLNPGAVIARFNAMIDSTLQVPTPTLSTPPREPGGLTAVAPPEAEAAWPRTAGAKARRVAGGAAAPKPQPRALKAESQDAAKQEHARSEPRLSPAPAPAPPAVERPGLTSVPAGLRAKPAPPAPPPPPAGPRPPPPHAAGPAPASAEAPAKAPTPPPPAPASPPPPAPAPAATAPAPVLSPAPRPAPAPHPEGRRGMRPGRQPSPPAAALTLPSELDQLLTRMLARTVEFVGVGETAAAVLGESLDRSGAEAGCVLLPDNGAWRVCASRGMRGIELTRTLGEEHWLMTEVVGQGHAFMVMDSDIMRGRLANAPLAAWRHLMGVPIAGVDGLILLARDALAFVQRDLEAIADVALEARPLLTTAMLVRQLGRALQEHIE